MKNKIGLIGILIALTAIGVAIFQDDLRPEQPSAAEKLKDLAVSKSIELLGGDAEGRRERDVVQLTYHGLGFIALVLGVVSFLRKESHQVAGAAGALGVIAIGWEFVLIGIIIAVVILILAYFSP